MTRTCAYGPCPVEFVPRKPWHEHCSPRCRNRAYVVRRDGEATDRIHASCDARETKISAPSGPQISYRRAVKAMTKFLIDFEPACGEGPDMVERIVGRALAQALPARQRERLEEKR